MPTNKAQLTKDAEKIFDLFFIKSSDEVDSRTLSSSSSEHNRTEVTEQSTTVHEKRKIPINDVPTTKKPRVVVTTEHQVSQSDDCVDIPYLGKNTVVALTGYARMSLRSGGSRAPLAVPESSRVTPGVSPSQDGVTSPLANHMECDVVSDETDGLTTDLPYHEKPEEEKDEIISEIAAKLGQIGDDYNLRGSASVSLSNASMLLAAGSVDQLVKDLTYENFQKAVTQATRGEPGLQQFVFAARLTSAVANRIGKPDEVKNFFSNYFTNNLTEWVETNGGWRGVLQLLGS